MPTFKWVTPATIATILSTELNSLGNTSFSASSATIDNAVDLYQYAELELVVATQGTARSAGATIEIWAERRIDGTNFEDRAVADLGMPIAVFSLDAAVTARRIIRDIITIPPCTFKLYARNRTGQALAASGNTLKMRRFNEQVT